MKSVDPLSPLGRGCEAMTYVRRHQPNHEYSVDGAVVSHSAELVRGDFVAPEVKAPHPPLRGTFSPRG
jgi:hypothetical protein